MIKNYLKVAWRNLIKNKVFSFINIAGLATGLACFALIALYVVDELSYDRYNDKADRIYRINGDIVFGGTEQRLAVTSDAMGAALKKDYPQVEQYCRIYNSSGPKRIKKDNVFLVEDDVAHADSTLFDVFTLPVLSGDPKTALDEPNTVVISETAARKYFGTTEAVGKTLETTENNGTLYKVTAVIKDIPHNSHFRFDFFFSMDNVEYGWGNHLSQNFLTYLVLTKGTDPKEFEKNFPQYIQKYVVPQAKQFMDISSIEEFEKAGNKISYSLMSLLDIHLHSNRLAEAGPNSNVQYIFIFSAVAIFILLIACINFMNLSTARSSNRAKEVGIRKVLGTERSTLVRQFLTESTMTALISTIIALVIGWLVLPLFNNIAAKELTISALFSPQVLPYLIALPLLVGLIAGSYPAFFLSAFKPISVLKGKINAGVKRSYLRGGLVVFQFFTSICLIVGTIVVYKQLNYIQTKQLGFNKEQLLVINGIGSLGDKTDAFKNEVLAMRGVTGGSISSFLPVTSSARNDNTVSKEAVMTSENGFNMQLWSVDYDYLKTMGMEIKAGRNFSKDFGSDSSGMIINETAAGLLGYENPVGQKIYMNNGGGTQSYIIIGIVKNFHFATIHEKIGPLSMVLGTSRGIATFKVATADIQSLIKQMENRWKAMAPSMPFTYRFMDDAFDEMYRAEQRIGKIAISFAVLAILIACLGLFGLVTYMAEQRTKEIGVRKVLGASVGNIVGMLSKDFLKLVLIAAVFAFPVAWWAMNEWLKDFAFRISIGWWIFLVAGVLAIMIALFTISFQAVKAALMNPIKSLRTE